MQFATPETRENDFTVLRNITYLLYLIHNCTQEKALLKPTISIFKTISYQFTNSKNVFIVFLILNKKAARAKIIIDY